MNPYNYPYGYPPPPGVAYPPIQPTVIVPTQVYPPPVMYPPQPVVYPTQPVMYPPQPVVYPPQPVLYPTQTVMYPSQPVYGGPQIPGVNGYQQRSISGHKFHSGFHVKRDNRHQFNF